MYNYFFVIIIAILVCDFLVGQWLNYLNRKCASPVLPDVLKGIYDEDAYKKQQNYFVANERFGVLTSTFSFLVILLFLIFHGFGWVDGIVRQFAEHPIPVALLFFAVIGLANSLIELPFTWYDTFVIEERFGFNKTTRKTFWLDFLKSLLLGAVIGVPLLCLIVWIYENTGAYFWLLAWGVISIFSIFLSMFYSEWIVPLFNKQTPLEAGELRDAIENFAQRAGFRLDNIFLIDGSKRSAKANAYFSGLGRKKRVVLYDTLIAELTVNEIVAVLAHEIGHYKKKHTLQMLFYSLINSGIMFFLLSLFLNNVDLAQALGAETPSFHLGVLGFGLLYAPVSFVTGILASIMSRKNEYQADAFAAQYGLAQDLCEGLKKISVKALSNLTPHPLYVFFHYSHPTLLQRLAKLTV
ncbi:MAG: M48 family metallopeptidase [Bacteroidales bacterium]|jgi:STE24 endopeptidase|nr:M48 family metallopeptidase [Bacteroidales bacterium]